MNNFDVFKHPDGTLICVKDGWSWFGFFFSGFWLFYRRVYVHGTIFLMIGGLFYGLFPSWPNLFGWGDLLGLILCLISGINGNSWVSANLKSRGYQRVLRVKARNEDDARAHYLVGGSRAEPTFF